MWSLCHLTINTHCTFRASCSLATKADTSYFTGSQDSRSKPLWIDCAMEDSIRSTYLTTRGAYRSCRCLWNFPLHRWTADKAEERDNNIEIHVTAGKNTREDDGTDSGAHSLNAGSRWEAGREGSCPSSRVIGSPGRRPCPQRRRPGSSLHVPPSGPSTTRRPEDTAGGKRYGGEGRGRSWMCVCFMVMHVCVLHHILWPEIHSLYWLGLKGRMD